MCIYAMAASLLPMWMLLTPRGYLSTYMKIGTIILLAVGVIIVNPELQAPAFSQYIGGGGPIFKGPMFPFVFITIACGAISGFHGLIASGTTSKLVDKESDIRPVGYMAMLFEGLVGVMALIAATALHPGDYYAINATPAVFATLNLPMVNLMDLQAQVGENVIGRTGGAVALAVGMAQIFSSIPGMRSLMSYWYHFAIMFEALFILTTIDSGTRVGPLPAAGSRRPRVEEMGRHQLAAERARVDRHHGGALGLLHLDGEHQHDLAAVRRREPVAGGRSDSRWRRPSSSTRAARSTRGPRSSRCASLRSRRMTAGWMNIRDNYWPLAIGPNPARHVEGYVDSIASVIMMVCAVVILIAAARRWMLVLSGKMALQTAEFAES